MRKIGLGNGLFSFGLLLAAYAAFAFVTGRDWLASGAIWAEGATNYWPAARSPQLLERLFATDSGYIPLPQRLAALPGAWLPARLWPFWLSLVSLVGAAALVGVFTSRRFRPLVASDFLRWMAALLALFVLDAETSGFINFIYLSVLPMAALAALALAGHDRPPPRWAWLLPVLCLSKPAVLTVLPAILLAAWRNPAFRRIALACLTMAVVQAVRMLVSHGDGAMAQQVPFSLGQRLIGTVNLCFGFLAAFVLPPAVLLPAVAKPVLGAALAALIVRHAGKASAGARVMLLVGGLIVVGNFALLAFTLGDDWLARPRLVGFDLMRQNLPAFLGAELIVLAIVGSMRPRFACLAFGAWCALTLGLALAPARHPVRPQASQWLALAGRIDAGRPLCVPVDPAGWVLGDECRSLGQGFQRGLALAYRGEPVTHLLLPRPRLSGQRIAAVAVAARADAPVSGRAWLVLADGRKVELAQVAPLTPDSGLLMFDAPGVPVADVVALDVVFTAAVVPGRYTVFTPGDVVTGWFGS